MNLEMENGVLEIIRSLNANVPEQGEWLSQSSSMDRLPAYQDSFRYGDLVDDHPDHLFASERMIANFVLDLYDAHNEGTNHDELFSIVHAFFNDSLQPFIDNFVVVGQRTSHHGTYTPLAHSIREWLYLLVRVCAANNWKQLKMNSLLWRAQLTNAFFSHAPHLVGESMVSLAKECENQGQAHNAKSIYGSVVKDLAYLVDSIDRFPFCETAIAIHWLKEAMNHIEKSTPLENDLQEKLKDIRNNVAFPEVHQGVKIGPLFRSFVGEQGFRTFFVHDFVRNLFSSDDSGAFNLEHVYFDSHTRFGASTSEMDDVLQMVQFYDDVRMMDQGDLDEAVSQLDEDSQALLGIVVDAWGV